MTQTYATTWSSLLATTTQPIILTGMFRDILAKHFQTGSIADPRLRDLVWRNALDGRILIETVHRWVPQQTEKRPAVIVKRNAYSNIRMGINNKHLGGQDMSGDEHFTTFWSGSHTLFCLGGTGAQAEVLANEVQRQLTEFGPAIQSHMGLMRFGVLQVDEVGELEESVESFVVPVTAGYIFSESWVLSQQAPRLSKISLSTILDF